MLAWPEFWGSIDDTGARELDAAIVARLNCFSGPHVLLLLIITTISFRHTIERAAHEPNEKLPGKKTYIPDSSQFFFLKKLIVNYFN